MTEAAPDVLVLAAHPALEHSRITRSLMQAARDAAAAPARSAAPAPARSAAAETPHGPGDGPASAARVAVRDLYALYPDYFIDVAAEQAALAAARLVVWLHPIQWYSMPPLMKLWVDEVLSFRWAYGPGGTALHGKDLWLVTSTGGPEPSYHPAGHNRYFFDAYLTPYEQTARLIGMRWLPPLVLHGAHRIEPAALAAHADLFAQRLQSWPQWPEMDELGPVDLCDVPADARPEVTERPAEPAPWTTAPAG
jgi:glutathione-regulated potassium-efflux system ancillary protein KefF